MTATWSQPGTRNSSAPQPRTGREDQLLLPLGSPVPGLGMSCRDVAGLSFVATSGALPQRSSRGSPRPHVSVVQPFLRLTVGPLFEFRTPRLKLASNLGATAISQIGHVDNSGKTTSGWGKLGAAEALTQVDGTLSICDRARHVLGALRVCDSGLAQLPPHATGMQQPWWDTNRTVHAIRQRIRQRYANGLNPFSSK